MSGSKIIKHMDLTTENWDLIIKRWGFHSKKQAPKEHMTAGSPDSELRGHLQRSTAIPSNGARPWQPWEPWGRGAEALRLMKWIQDLSSACYRFFWLPWLSPLHLLMLMSSMWSPCFSSLHDQLLILMSFHDHPPYSWLCQLYPLVIKHGNFENPPFLNCPIKFTLWWTNIAMENPPCLMGKSTISMAIFHCYVSSPEAIQTSPVPGAFPMIFPWSHGIRPLRADWSRWPTMLRSPSQDSQGRIGGSHPWRISGFHQPKWEHSQETTYIAILRETNMEIFK